MSEEIIVFAGPTIGADEIRSLLPSATVLGPAMCSDVYVEAQRRPIAIGIIDGLFESVPAIFHKEVLWALANGVRVVGAASMGAIRAAELDVFGMEGVGQAYQLLKNGEIDDDDVAVAHATAEYDYRSLSEPLVNMHVTLGDAVEAGLIRADEASLLRSLAKQHFYPDRSYPQMLEDGRDNGIDANRLAALERWLVNGRRNVKRDDALALLARLAELSHAAAPFVADFRFNRTVYFRSLQDDAARRPARGTGRHQDVLEELRLRPKESAGVLPRAEARAFATELARMEREPLDQESVDEASDRVRRHLALLLPEEFRSWLENSGLTLGHYGRIIRDEARRTKMARAYGRAVEAALLDELLLDGRLGPLRDRALQKAALLAGTAANDGAPRPDIPVDGVLLAGFFEENDITPSPDPDYEATALGFADADALLRALRREWLFRCCTSAAAETSPIITSFAEDLGPNLEPTSATVGPERGSVGADV